MWEKFRCGPKDSPLVNHEILLLVSVSSGQNDLYHHCQGPILQDSGQQVTVWTVEGAVELEIP